MALYEMTPGHGASIKLARPVELVCFALVVAHAVYLATAYVIGIWIVGPDGRALLKLRRGACPRCGGTDRTPPSFGVPVERCETCGYAFEATA